MAAGEVDLGSLPAEEIFRLLESNNQEVVSEIHRLFYENLSETRDPWLVSGLYDHHAATGSLQSLKLLITVKEPHDKLLCDRLAEGLRSSSGRDVAIDVLGYIVRKQPTWLHKVVQHPVFHYLLKLLKSESDLCTVVPCLLVLTALLPAVSTKLGSQLPDMFEVFGRLASLSSREGGSTLASTHLTVGLYALFHRLYGMFPCNFLSWLRNQYPEQNSSTGGVFSTTIAPLLASVRLHPLLVTQSREQERTAIRWKGLSEVHDVVAECSRYSLTDTPCTSSSSYEEPSQALPDPRYRPRLHTGVKVAVDSPPEAAIEATPDNTPYDTPSKESPNNTKPLRLSSVSQPPHIRSLNFRSPIPPASPSKPVQTTPIAESSPFKWPEPGRSSVMAEDSSQVPQSVLGKRDSLGLGLVPVETETEDAEVSQLTGNQDARSRHFSSRRITPHFSDSPRPLSSLAPSPGPIFPNHHDPPSCSVNELVHKVRTRVRCITLCEQEAPQQPQTKPALSRASSCPDILLQDFESPTRGTEARGQKLRFTSGTQTEAGLFVLPHEYLFPLALPSTQHEAPPSQQVSPQEVLDSYISAAVEGGGSLEDGVVLRLLKAHLQWEVGRREVLGARNRRLLGVSKGVRELQEQKVSLEDQLMVMRNEVTSLNAQLAGVRVSKHQTEEERAESSRIQENEILQLRTRVQQLELENRRLTERAEEKEKTASEARADCDEARGALFQAQARLETLNSREGVWATTSKEVENLKKQLVLQGELVMRYAEKLEQLPVAGKAEEMRLIQEAASHEVAAAKTELVHVQQELTACTARASQLEGRVSILESALAQQEEILVAAQEEMQEKILAADERYAGLRSVNIHLEGNILELQERWARGEKRRGKKGGSPSNEFLESLGPGSSAVGSQGSSDAGEYIRRMVESPPVHLGREASVSGGSAPVGSAHSALHLPGLNRGGTSNGQHH